MESQKIHVPNHQPEGLQVSTSRKQTPQVFRLASEKNRCFINLQSHRSTCPHVKHCTSGTTAAFLRSATEAPLFIISSQKSGGLTNPNETAAWWIQFLAPD